MRHKAGRRLKQLILGSVSFATAVGIALVGNWLWRGHQKPKLDIQYGMGVQEWSQTIRGDTAYLNATLSDAFTGKLAVRLRSVAPRALVAAYPGEKELLIKAIVRNSGRSAATNLRIPIYVSLPGHARIEYSPQVEAELRPEADDGAGFRVDAIRIASMPPRTSAVIAYHFALDDTVWKAAGEQPIQLRVRPPTADEVPEQDVKFQEAPLGVIAVAENKIGIVGAPVLTQRFRRGGAPGSLEACVDSADAWYRELLTLCGGRHSRPK